MRMGDDWHFTGGTYALPFTGLLSYMRRPCVTSQPEEKHKDDTAQQLPQMNTWLDWFTSGQKPIEVVQETSCLRAPSCFQPMFSRLQQCVTWYPQRRIVGEGRPTWSRPSTRFFMLFFWYGDGCYMCSVAGRMDESNRIIWLVALSKWWTKPMWQSCMFLGVG